MVRVVVESLEADAIVRDKENAAEMGLKRMDLDEEEEDEAIIERAMAI